MNTHALLKTQLASPASRTGSRQSGLRIYPILKRCFDVAASAVGLIVLAPAFAIVALAIRLDSKGPVLFCQKRVGRGDSQFRIFKFRTMCIDAEKLGTKLTVSNDPRVTRIGRFLRQTKIDELPQLINVLKGDMSLVGPRPESPEYMTFYASDQRARILRLRPGVTDFASVLLRNESELFPPGADPVEIYRRQVIPLKLSCYERYFREMGFITDARIILATLVSLIAGSTPGWLGVDIDAEKARGQTSQTPSDGSMASM
jgi:lipopolysaccharide/colanic/teichoic acid biosynthesis glycosyltransferase